MKIKLLLALLCLNFFNTKAAEVADDFEIISNVEANPDEDLFNAVVSGNVENVQKVLQMGANQDCRNAKGETPLIMASGRGFDDIVQLLIDSKVNVNLHTLDESGDTALLAAVRNTRYIITGKLLKAGADMDLKDYQGRSFADYVLLGCQKRAAQFLSIVRLSIKS